uniref:NADH-ubiquinone oxidoreductase chain 4L n=1 Tax=Cyclophorus martensianus TaxID=494924 RepID=A0A4P8VUG6_9CAEN|nr:NADH dehydrogenase subunit 4L [Cyclophorus martensianus]
MNICLVFISSFGFMASFLGLSFHYNHLLSVLLALEAISMNLFFLVFVTLSYTMSSEISLIMITLSACEASLGLSILVSVIRSWGNDYVLSLSLQSC